MVAIRGHFDGRVFIPDGPVDLPRGQSVILHVETTARPTEKPRETDSDFFRVLDSLAGSVNAPADWSAEHDHYLYGTPKRDQKQRE